MGYSSIPIEVVSDGPEIAYQAGHQPEPAIIRSRLNQIAIHEFSCQKRDLATPKRETR
jgi:hypothetical protein